MVVRISANDLPAKMPRGCEVWDVGFGKLSDAKFLKELESVLLSKGEHAAQNLLKATSVELGDYEELVPRIADKASGNASILYPQVYSLYDFNVDYNPLSADSTYWATFEGRDVAKAANNRWERVSYSYSIGAYYYKIQAPTADYGVKWLVGESGDFTGRLDIRADAAVNQNSYLFARVAHANLDRVQTYVSGEQRTLASRTKTTGWTSMRFEVAGSGPTGIALYPYKNEVEIGTLTVTGQGQHDQIGYAQAIARNDTATTYDDFAIMVAAGGARGLDAGAFGLGRGGRGLSPNGAGL